MVDKLPEENDPEHDLERHEIEEWVIEAQAGFRRKLESLGEHAEPISSFIMLSVIDDKWKDHLYDLDHLKASIGFRGWGQKDPLVEYKKEAYEMFVDLMTDLRKTVASYFFRAQFGQPQQRQRAPQRLAYSGPSEEAAGGGTLSRAGAAAAAGQAANGQRGRATSWACRLGRPRPGQPGYPLRGRIRVRWPPTAREEREKVPVSVEKEPGRNDPCPCGSPERSTRSVTGRGEGTVPIAWLQWGEARQRERFDPFANREVATRGRRSLLIGGGTLAPIWTVRSRFRRRDHPLRSIRSWRWPVRPCRPLLP
jgi:preprotein translocase subunit SecA